MKMNGIDLRRGEYVKKFLVLLLSASAVTTAVSINALAYSGVVYEQGSQKSKKLYTYQNTPTEQGELTNLQADFMDLSGQVVVSETAVLKGLEVVSYKIDHKQLKSQGQIEVRDGKIYFTKINADGSKKTDDESLEKNFVVSMSFTRFVKSKWQDIIQGKEVEIRYGVWDRLETVGFTLAKTGEETINNQKAIVVRMKPTSFVIAALVKPVFFKISEDGSMLMEMNGRVAPKKADGNSWKDLDAEIVYQN